MNNPNFQIGDSVAVCVILPGVDPIIIPKTEIVESNFFHEGQTLSVIINGVSGKLTIRKNHWSYRVYESGSMWYPEIFLRKIDDGEYDIHEEELIEELLPSES